MPLPSKDIEFLLAGQGEEEELRRLLREIPMDGSISLTFEREPDFHLATTVEGERSDTVLARERPSGRGIGLGSLATRDAWINGEQRSLGYLSQLRISEPYRARRHLLTRAYDFMRQELGERSGADFHVSTIVENNLAARRYLTSGVPGLPRYQERDTLCTLAIPLHRWQKSPRTPGVVFRFAKPDDLPDISALLQSSYQPLQFAPVWTSDDLADSERTRGLEAGDFIVGERKGRLVACGAIWDQGEFKQTVVKSYQGKLERWRRLLNAVRPFTSLPHLPPPGGVLTHATLSHFAVAEWSPELAFGLVSAAGQGAWQRGIRTMSLGLCQSNPVLAPVKKQVRHLEYRSLIYSICWSGDTQAEKVMDGACHLEIATL